MSKRTLLLLVFAASVMFRAERPDASTAPLPESVLILIDQTYEYRKPTLPTGQDLEGFELPLLDYVEDMLFAADIEPLDDATSAATWEIRISLRGRALGRLYFEFNKTYLYSGADLAGEIVVVGPGDAADAREFSSIVERPFEVQINRGYEHPENAPFLEALVRPDGFLEALCHAMIDAWGVASVLPSLEEPSAAIRYSIAAALGTVGDPVAVSALVEALEDEHDRVRWEAAWSLGLIGERRAVPDLIDALKDPSQDVRWFASWSLRTITGKDIGPDYDLWSDWWSRHGEDAQG